MISIQGLSKSFAEKPVLADISLELATGQTHVLLGSSGSGKSTLLRIITGISAPDAGAVAVDGVRVVAQEECPLTDRLGYMTQEGGLFPHLTAAENVVLPAKVRGQGPAERAARLHELAGIVGLDEALLGRYPCQLSGGQRQRVALIRALFLFPRYVLLDEPLGALDPIIRRDLQTTLKSVFNNAQWSAAPSAEQVRATVVLVTHDVGEAAYFGDTITLLHQGRILQHGSLTDFVRHPAHPFVTEFLMAQRPVPQLEALSR